MMLPKKSLLLSIVALFSGFLVEPWVVLAQEDLEPPTPEAEEGNLEKLLSFFGGLIDGGAGDGDDQDTLDSLTETFAGMDISEFFANITIPEEFIGVIDVEVLFSDVFAPILAFFGVPGYEKYAQDGDFEPVPFGSECQFCDGLYDKTQEHAGLTCQAWEIFAGFSSGEECSLLRATAVKSCGCDMWEPEEPVVYPPTCHLCSKHSETMGQEDIQTLLTSFVGADRRLPILSTHLRCTDILKLPAVDGEEQTCGDIHQFADFCGCDYVLPTEEQCTLCPAGTVPRHPDEVVIYSNSRNITCAALHNEFIEEPKGDSCNDLHRQMSSGLGQDIQAFCGCPRNPASWTVEGSSAHNNICQPCRPGYVVRMDGLTPETTTTTVVKSFFKQPQPKEQDEKEEEEESKFPGATCYDWGEELKALTSDDPLCEALQTTVMPGCCIPESQMPPEEDSTSVTTAGVAMALESSSSHGHPVGTVMILLSTVLSFALLQ